eukprot:scaffold5825_cov62-Cyclotella_meneghiniana.AAC.6
MKQSQYSTHDEDASKHRQFPPPPPPPRRQHLARGYSAGSSSSSLQPSSFAPYGNNYTRSKSGSSNNNAAALKFNPSYTDAPTSFASYTDTATAASSSQKAAVTEEATRRHYQNIATAEAGNAAADVYYPQTVTTQHNNDNTQQRQQYQSISDDNVSSYYGGKDTLKSRNNNNNDGSAITSSALRSYPPPNSLQSSNSSSYMLGSGTKQTTINSNNKQTTPHNNNNNNGGIAILIFPPLLLLLTYEMPSSIPLLLLFCVSLIVYAVDLSNFGNGGCYYTLVGIWGGWAVMSATMAHALITAGLDNNSNSGYVVNVGGDGDDDESSEIGDDNGELRMSRFMGIIVVMGHLLVSVVLLFCLATWTTLQFQWLTQRMPRLARLLERILHFTLPPVSASIIAYELLNLSSMSSSYITWGVDLMALILPYMFASHLTLGIWLVGAAPSVMGGSEEGNEEEEVSTKTYSKEDKKNDYSKRDKSALFECAINPWEGRMLSNLLVFAPSLIHAATFRQRIIYSYASWDDVFDFILVSTVPYLLHYLLASNGVLDENWRRSLNWFLKAGTSTAGGGRTIRGAAVPMTISLLASTAFQHRYLIALCARASYIINGHEGVVSATMATTYLTVSVLLMYASFWFLGRQHEDGTPLLGEYHEDVFQLLLGSSAIFLGLSFSPPWSFLPIPMLLIECMALWVLTKQLRWTALTIFVMFTVGILAITYRLTFLNETVDILPNKKIILKRFAQYALYAGMLLTFFVGLVHRAPGGVLEKQMKKWDATGICLTIYCLVLVVLEFALLRCPMPIYSRDNFEVGRVAVYSPATAYITGLLCLIIAWHLNRNKFIKAPCSILSSSIAVAKMIAVLIEENLLDGDDSLKMIYIRWTVTAALLTTISAPYLLVPVHVKMPAHNKKFGPSGKPDSNIPQNARAKVIGYCFVVLPLVIVTSVRLVIEPLVGILIGHGNSASYFASPKLSEVIGYSVSIWGLAVLQMINHFLPDGGADAIRRLSALIFVMGLFVAFSAPAIPGTNYYAADESLYKSLSSLDTDDNNSSGGWGLISAFLAIMLAITGPLELSEVHGKSGRTDTHHLLRLMIFGTMFGCGLAWFITMQSMNKDIFIPIFVTSFSTMAMSFLGTVASVMSYFLETKDFGEAEQIANVWAGVGFPLTIVSAPLVSVSLSAHAHPFGIGGWASTYLSVCGIVTGAYTILIRMRGEKNSTTRGYGNASCVMSWACAISVIYGRYGVSGVGVVGATSVAGIPMSVLGTLLCSPILLLLEGEPSDGGKKYYQSSSKSTKKGLCLPSLTRSNWYVPPMAATVTTFVVATIYAIFLRGSGLSKFSLLFGAEEAIKHHNSRKTSRGGTIDKVAMLAQNSIVHTKTMINAARLNESGLWTSKSFTGPILHLAGLLLILPFLYSMMNDAWRGKSPTASRVRMLLPLSILSMFIGRGIPSLVAAAMLTFVGGLMQLSSAK